MLRLAHWPTAICDRFRQQLRLGLCWCQDAQPTGSRAAFDMVESGFLLASFLGHHQQQASKSLLERREARIRGLTLLPLSAPCLLCFCFCAGSGLRITASTASFPQVPESLLQGCFDVALMLIRAVAGLVGTSTLIDKLTQHLRCMRY